MANVFVSTLFFSESPMFLEKRVLTTVIPFLRKSKEYNCWTNADPWQQRKIKPWSPCRSTLQKYSLRLKLPKPLLQPASPLTTQTFHTLEVRILVSLCTGFLQHTIQIENQLETQYYNRIKEANTSLTWNLKVENTIVNRKTKSKAKMEKKGVNSGEKIWRRKGWSRPWKL